MMKQALIVIVVCYLGILLAVVVFQRSLLYFPSQEVSPNSTLKPWVVDGERFGYCHEDAGQVWLMLHGNAGQAAYRDYALASLPAGSSLYVLEYPGYGARAGSPSRESINAAARQAYQALRKQHRDVAVLGESIGSGPASFLAMLPDPPSRIVLVTPFDALANAGAAHFPWLPVKALLRDNWDNVEALRQYKGAVDIYVATSDEVIPPALARNLASQISTAKLHEIPGGHNDWSVGAKVRIH
jgi:hypothetical protein